MPLPLPLPNPSHSSLLRLRHAGAHPSTPFASTKNHPLAARAQSGIWLASSHLPWRQATPVASLRLPRPALPRPALPAWREVLILSPVRSFLSFPPYHHHHHPSLSTHIIIIITTRHARLLSPAGPPHPFLPLPRPHHPAHSFLLVPLAPTARKGWPNRRRRGGSLSSRIGAMGRAGGGEVEAGKFECRGG